MIIGIIVTVFIILILALNIDCGIEFRVSGNVNFDYWIRIGFVNLATSPKLQATRDANKVATNPTTASGHPPFNKGALTSHTILDYIHLFIKFKSDVNWLVNYLISKLILIKSLHLDTVIGTGDAAITGQVYGVACPTVYSLIALLNNKGRVQKQDIAINPDFDNEVLNIDFSMLIRARVYRIIRIGIKLIHIYFKLKGEENESSD